MELEQALRILDFDIRFFQQQMEQALDRGGIGEVSAEIDRFKIEVKCRYRGRSKVLHPDVKGDHEKMVELNSARDVLMELKIIIRQPTVVWRHVYSPFNDATSAGNSTSYTYTGTANGY